MGQRAECSAASAVLPRPRSVPRDFSPRSLGSEGGLYLRPATAHDRPLLRAIASESRADEFTGLPAQLASTLLALQYAAFQRHRTLCWPDATDHVIDHRNVPAGVVTTDLSGDHFRLIDLSLLPGFRKQGHATAIVNTAAAVAAESGLSLRFRISTARVSPSFLKRFGARIVAQGATYAELEMAPPTAPSDTDSRVGEAADAAAVAPFLGEIRKWDRTEPPPGWRWCDGALLDVVDHPNLFALLGDEFGGDGERTFQLPSLSDGHGPHGSFMIAVDTHSDLLAV